MEDNINQTKQINIIGTTNRYQIKKLTTHTTKKKRIISSKWNIQEKYYDKEMQLEILKTDTSTNQELHNIKSLIISQVETKISGYTQQDNIKKIKDHNVISLEETIKKLVASKLNCLYCNKDLLVLYEIAREMKQWTLDRIDNDQGHTYDNVVIACLECNLQRRRTNSDKFLFTKQMKIVRS